MPFIFIYLIILLLTIFVFFTIAKRPIYEAIFYGFVVLLLFTGKWNNALKYINIGLKTSLIYSMVSFIALSIVLTETKIIDSCVLLILSLVGGFTGGAGYVSVLSSAFMGALSGSGPGNVMATGTITIPAMIKSGFPPELAANIESNSSCLGNTIPPSSNILAAFGAYMAVYPNDSLSIGKFWFILWGISLWFIIQRLIMVYLFCKYYRIKPTKGNEIPSFIEALKIGWKGLVLPLILLLPFIFDYICNDNFLILRLGAQNAKRFSSSLLMFTAGYATIIIYFLIHDKKILNIKTCIEWFSNSIKTIVPAVGVCLIGYMIGGIFKDIDANKELELFFYNLNLNKISLVSIICVLTCMLGMVIPGSSLVVVFGATFIKIFSIVGINPVLAAGMLPSICGVMCGITPPLGLGFYAAMGLAKSNFVKTFKNNIYWVAAQFIIEVLILIGLLPIMGLYE